MSEAIKECLNHPKSGENARKLLIFCKEAKAYDQFKRSGLKGGADGIFKALVDLKKLGALVFEDGKYVTTKLGQEVFDSLS